MVFSEEQMNIIKSHIDNQKFKKLCIELNICDGNDTQEQFLNKINDYIENDMMGKVRGQYATDKFLKSIQAYLENNDFEKNDQGYIDYNLVLPIANLPNREGLRAQKDILGHDRKQYIVKQAEGFKGAISGFNSSKDARYNPTIAYSLFKFLDVPCARNVVAYETFPYYYIFSENFLKENQSIYGLDNEEFIGKIIGTDENMNITHKDIMESIDETVVNKNLPIDKSSMISKKMKLQYAVQETLKCLICSMDENLRNTSIVVTKGENGEIEDMNISPAYDLDLSFNLGEEMLKGIPESQVLYRTTENGKTDLVSIINEFKSIEGYKEALQEIKNKLNNNYIDNIFDIAYEESGISRFNERDMREKYGSFIMRKVAEFKEACRETNEIDKIK